LRKVRKTLEITERLTKSPTVQPSRLVPATIDHHHPIMKHTALLLLAVAAASLTLSACQSKDAAPAPAPMPSGGYSSGK